jgi:hypothetical protein
MFTPAYREVSSPISMQLAMMDAADRDCVLVADLAAIRAWSRKANVVCLGGRAAADNARSSSDEFAVLLVV